MIKRMSGVICLLAVSLLWAGKAPAQTPPPEALAAAKEFIVAAKMVDQMKQVMTVMLQNFRPPGLQNNPRMDAISAVVIHVMNSHLEAYVNEAAQIYARHFTVDEIRQLTAFYRTPAGEKLLQKTPELSQEIAAYLQKISPVINEQIKKGVEEALRKL